MFRVRTPDGTLLEYVCLQAILDGSGKALGFDEVRLNS